MIGGLFFIQMYSVYILYSISTKQFYKGHTKELSSRLMRHNAGYEKFTSTGMPWSLIWHISKPNKGEAYQLELKLKNLTSKRLIEFMLKYKEGIESADELDFIIKLSAC